MECNRRARFSSKTLLRVAFQQNNAFEQFETTAITLMSWPSRRLIHTALGRYNLFFGNWPRRRRSRVIVGAHFAVDCACGGAYLVGCWGVVQSVGHLTVNEDGGGSNPPAPANFPSKNRIMVLVLSSEDLHRVNSRPDVCATGRDARRKRAQYRTRGIAGTVIMHCDYLLPSHS
jgi:hypothetical protein